MVNRSIASQPLYIITSLHLCYQWNISLSDFRNEVHIRAVEHHMEVFNRMHRFERLPILEPDDL